MARFGGNGPGPGGGYGADGINAPGYSDGSWGPDDAIGAKSIDQKGNRGGLARDQGYGKKSFLDHDPIPSKARAKASSGSEYIPNSWYGGPPSRQEK